MTTSASREDPRSWEERGVCLDCKFAGEPCMCGCGWLICGKDGSWTREDMTCERFKEA